MASDNFARGLVSLLTGGLSGYSQGHQWRKQREDELARAAAEEDYRKQSLARLLAGDEADAKQRALDLEKYKLNLQMGPDDTATPWTNQMGPFENQYHGGQLGELIINQGTPDWQKHSEWNLAHGVTETAEQRARREAAVDERYLANQMKLLEAGRWEDGGEAGAEKPPMTVGQFLNFGTDMGGDTSSMAYELQRNKAGEGAPFPSYDAWLRQKQGAGLARADSLVAQYAGRGMTGPQTRTQTGPPANNDVADVRAARLTGVSDEEIVGALRMDGVPESEIARIMAAAGPRTFGGLTATTGNVPYR